MKKRGMKSSSTSKLRKIICLNNNGSDLLVNGHIDQAFYSFKRALASITQLIEQANFEESLPVSTPTMIDDSVVDTEALCFPSNALHFQSTADSDPTFFSVTIPNFRNEDFYIHNKALFIIQDREITDPKESLFLLSCYYNIVLFNKALTFHMIGKVQGKTLALWKAAHFYEICTERIGANLKDSDHMQMLRIMGVNNTAQIFFELNHFRECGAFLNYLFVNLQYSGILLVHDFRDIHTTLLNIFVYRAPSHAPVA